MARDYVKKRQTRQQSQAPRRFLIAIASFLCGYLVATVFDFSSLTSWVNKQVQAYKGKDVPLPQQVVAKKQELPKPKFEFYTLLAKDGNSPANRPAPVTPIKMISAQPVPVQTVTNSSSNQQIAPVTESKPVSVKNNINKESYQVQIASFNKRPDAEHLKASLVMQGFDVNITQTSQNNISWFRVVIGPFPSRGEAEKAQINVARSERMKGMIRKVDV